MGRTMKWHSRMKGGDTMKKIRIWMAALIASIALALGCTLAAGDEAPSSAQPQMDIQERFEKQRAFDEHFAKRKAEFEKEYNEIKRRNDEIRQKADNLRDATKEEVLADLARRLRKRARMRGE